VTRVFFMGQLSFLSPNQWCQSTEANSCVIICMCNFKLCCLCTVDVPLWKYVNEVLRAQRVDVLGNGLCVFLMPNYKSTCTFRIVVLCLDPVE